MLHIPATKVIQFSHTSKHFTRNLKKIFSQPCKGDITS